AFISRGCLSSVCGFLRNYHSEMSESDSEDESKQSQRPESAMSIQSDTSNLLPETDCMKRRLAIREIEKVDSELDTYKDFNN
ncbi:hypothetical protein TNCV_619651, partial [Trichonephila clavipes]